MTTYICKCGRRVKKSTDASTTGNRLSGYVPGHECWGCPYAIPYGDFQWDESARTVSRETRGYECRMSKTLTYASEFAGSIKDKCTCRVHSLDFDFLSQVSAWIKDNYPDREIFGSFSKDIRASDYGSDGRYCLTITCTQNLKGVAAKRELFGQFFNPDGSRKDMTPQQEMEKILTDIKKAKEGFSCASAPSVDAAATTDTPAPCICSTCTCGGCKEECFGNCHSCGHPVQECNSYQTEGEKHLHPAHSADVTEPVGNIPAAPSFDFSPLGDLAGAAADADQQFDLHYGTAQDEYLVSCIYLARIHALTAKAGRYGGGTWTKWYESKGLSHGSVTKMVQNGEAFNSSTVDELKQLPNLTRKDLNLIARSGCADQVVAAAGDSQRVQDLLAQLKAEKDRADAAEKSAQNARKENAYFKELVKSAEAQTSKDAERREEAESRYESALADISGLKEQNVKLQQSYHDADESRIAANLQRQKAEAERDRAEARAKDAENQLVGSRQVAEAAKLRGDKLKAENDVLKSQPITAVVDEEEVDRRAGEKAYQMAAEMTADLRAQLEQTASGSEQDAHSSYDNVLLADRSFQNIGKMVIPSLRKLPQEQREAVANQLIRTLGQIQGEVSQCL